MSVPKSKRGKSQLEIVTKANELAEYTIHICSNEQHFPKRYHWAGLVVTVQNLLRNWKKSDEQRYSNIG